MILVRTILRNLFLGFFFISTSVLSDNLIPSIEKLSQEKVPVLESGEPFYGCIYRIEWGDEDLFTKTRGISSVKIGNTKESAELFVQDFNELFQGDDGVPKVGDCFAFTTLWGLGQFPDGTYMGMAKIYQSPYKVDHVVEVKILNDEITVDEYFEQNVSYGKKRLTLVGEVEETGVTSIGDEFFVSLVSHEGKTITAYLSSTRWKNSDLMRDKLRAIQMGDVLKLKGYFLVEMGSPSFEIIKILDFGKKRQEKKEEKSKTTISSSNKYAHQTLLLELDSVWCANESHVFQTTESYCKSRKLKSFSTKTQAQAEHLRLKNPSSTVVTTTDTKKTEQTESSSTTSSSDSRGWCANQFNSFETTERSCKINKGIWFASNKNSADAEHLRLKTPSSTVSITTQEKTIKKQEPKEEELQNSKSTFTEEIVELKDGRMIRLRSDGTYELID